MPFVFRRGPQGKFSDRLRFGEGMGTGKNFYREISRNQRNTFGDWDKYNPTYKAKESPWLNIRNPPTL